MNAFVVMVACNLDDVLAGVFPHTAAGLDAAQKCGLALLVSPDLRHNGVQASDSGIVAVKIFEVSGSVVVREFASLDYADVELGLSGLVEKKQLVFAGVEPQPQGETR